MTLATMEDGTRVASRQGVYMRPIVRLDRPEDSIYVRSHRWVRYSPRIDGRTRMTGRGVARS